jgi:hypothetical protein
LELINNILPSLFLIIGGVISWFLKDKSEKLKYQREKLLIEKRENYEKILEPIIRVFVGINNQQEMSKALKQIQSFDYRKTSFHLMMFGSGEVIHTYNDFFQFIYGDLSKEEPEMIMLSLGKVVLSIRKDLGNDKTVLKDYDMLSFMLSDIDRIKEKYDGKQKK